MYNSNTQQCHLTAFWAGCLSNDTLRSTGLIWTSLNSICSKFGVSFNGRGAVNLCVGAFTCNPVVELFIRFRGDPGVAGPFWEEPGRVLLLLLELVGDWAPVVEDRLVRRVLLGWVWLALGSACDLTRAKMSWGLGILRVSGMIGGGLRFVVEDGPNCLDHHQASTRLVVDYIIDHAVCYRDAVLAKKPLQIFPVAKFCFHWNSWMS